MINDHEFITVKAASCCTLQALKVVDNLQLLGRCMLIKTESLLHDTYKPELDSTSYEQCVRMMYMCAVQDQQPAASKL